MGVPQTIKWFESTLELSLIIKAPECTASDSNLWPEQLFDGVSQVSRETSRKHNHIGGDVASICEEQARLRILHGQRVGLHFDLRREISRPAKKIGARENIAQNQYILTSPFAIFADVPTSM